MNSFAKHVRVLMAKHNVSERKLAQLSGLNRQTLRRQFAGLADFGLSDAQKILRVFGLKMTLLIEKSSCL
jgi:hypothetical protein